MPTAERRVKQRLEYQRTAAEKRAQKRARYAARKEHEQARRRSSHFNDMRKAEGEFGKAHPCPDCSYPMFPLALERCGFCTEEKELGMVD